MRWTLSKINCLNISYSTIPMQKELVVVENLLLFKKNISLQLETLSHLHCFAIPFLKTVYKHLITIFYCCPFCSVAHDWVLNLVHIAQEKHSRMCSIIFYKVYAVFIVASMCFHKCQACGVKADLWSLDCAICPRLKFELYQMSVVLFFILIKYINE